MLATGVLTNTGPHTTALEGVLTSELGMHNPVLVANGTIAIMLALGACLPDSGEVIMPSFTFPATANAAIWAGLEPVFGDVNAETMALDPSSAEEVIGPNTVAIMPVNPFGQMSDVGAFQALCDRHGLALVFDSAQAVGIRYRGELVGGFGNAEAFSFHATKVLPMGEGGVVSSRDEGVSERVRSARNFGLGATGNARGLNGKITEFAALLGLRGVDVLSEHLACRRLAAETMRSRLKNIPGVELQAAPPEVISNEQNLSVRIRAADFGLSADQVAESLAADNIFARRYFHPCLHQVDAFAQVRRGDLGVSELLATESLTLPVYSDMAVHEAELVGSAVAELHEHADAIAASLS